MNKDVVLCEGERVGHRLHGNKALRHAHPLSGKQTHGTTYCLGSHDTSINADKMQPIV